ncbi:metallophosphoesterase [Candidatus Woesearchaeota archaeon]|nr:metallophosphoesterase [Candidatus Woesearchaeota archaeon]
MKILPNMNILDLALYFDYTVVIADAHIGYEEALNKQGVLVPRFQFEDIVKRMERVFDYLKGKKIECIIVNGDLKHEFGTISEQEWRNTLKFIDLLSKHCNEVILIKGNHDTILGPIARKRNVNVVDEIGIGKVLVCHGNKVPNIKNYDAIIIGHEHPAVSLKEGPRVEQYKCFLRGKYKGKKLIVQPSFNSLVEGTDLLRDKILSPFLHQNLDNFDVYIVEDKVYHFGKLRNLRKG